MQYNKSVVQVLTKDGSKKEVVVGLLQVASSMTVFVFDLDVDEKQELDAVHRTLVTIAKQGDENDARNKVQAEGDGEAKADTEAVVSENAAGIS